LACFSGMRIAVLLQLHRQLYGTMGKLYNAFNKYEELSIYAHRVTMGIQRLQTYEPRLLELPVNDTVMSTGIKTQESFGKNISEQLQKLTGLTFVAVSNKFEDFNTYNIMAELSGTLNQLAVSFSKIKDNHVVVNI
jgi:fumarate hydratase class II